MCALCYAPLSYCIMIKDSTAQKTTKVAWPCDKDAWKQTSSTAYFAVNSPAADIWWGGQRTPFKDYVKLSLSKRGIPFNRLEELVKDREEWCVVCNKGLATFDLTPYSYLHVI